jgi:signal transduction histidine kinase
MVPPAHDEALDATIDGQPFRLEWLRTRRGWLLAGESLTELGHVEAVLALSEAVAFPFLLAAFFLVALAIGLRSARPVEIARRRQLEFTADASHELRTPLSVIEAEVSLARSRPREPAELVATLDRVAGESRRLRRIVEDLLWLARADAEPAPLGRELVDLGAVARSLATRLDVIARPRGQTIEVVAPPTDGQAALVSAPPDWIDRLVGTLVDNACRYTPDGGRIRLTVSRTATTVSLCVEDNGPGIPVDEREQVFNRFRRATAAPGGHGLGLAIARAVAQGTGGRLTIGTSELGGARLEASWAAP